MADKDSPVPPMSAEANTLVNAMLQVPLPRFYANGFAVALGNVDLTIVLQLANQPSAAISLSLQSAKALGRSITEAVTQYEKITGVRVVDPTEANELMLKFSAEQKP